MFNTFVLFSFNVRGVVIFYLNYLRKTANLIFPLEKGRPITDDSIGSQRVKIIKFKSEKMLLII